MKPLGWLQTVVVALCLLAPMAGTCAPTPVTVRSGDHPGFGRLVFDLPAEVTPDVTVTDGLVTIALPATNQPASVPRNPRNVQAIRMAGPTETRISFAPGSQVRRSRQGTKLVLDFLDPPTPTPVADRPAPKAVPPPPPPPPRPIAKSAAPADTTRPAPAPPPAPAATPAPPPSAPPPSLELIAKASSSVEAGETGTVIIPFDADVGAAAFWRDGRIIVVFDQRRPVDVTGLRDVPAFAAASVRLVANGTVITIPAQPGTGVTLARNPNAWSISLRRKLATDPTEDLRLEFAQGEVRIGADAPGQVVVLADPDNGAPLLVGTLRRPHAATATARQTPDFRMPATFLGVVVEPVADRTTMRATRSGFVLGGGATSALALSDTSAADPSGRTLSRRFDFPALELDALLRRLQAAQAAAATAPPQTRTARRTEVAQALLALGLAAEAQSLLSLTIADDGRAASSRDISALQAIAAVLAGRPDEATGLAGDPLDGSDEVTLWRGLLLASKGQNPRAAAQLLAATYPILLDYPAPLQDRMLPLAAETLTRGAEMAAARKLVAAKPNEPRLDLARAAIARTEARENDTTAAMTILERVARTTDRRARARALGELVELGLIAHTLTPAQAADRMEQSLYAWRGDDHELQRRRRLAVLRADAGQWKPAIAVLRESAELWPEQAKDLRAPMSEVFSRAIAAEGKQALSPFDLVALAADNADLLPEGAKGLELAARISDQLERLELPQRSAEVLARLMQATPSGPGKAEFGLRLAAQRQQLNDPAGALDALTISHTPDLPPELRERRALAFARSAVASGDLPSALSALAAVNSVPALLLQAEFLERADDWPGAADALRAIIARSVPAEGPIDRDGATLILRLASAAMRSADKAALSLVRATYLPRLGGSEFASMLDLVTAEPIDGVADFSRAAKEARLARALPEAVKTLVR